MAVLFTVGLMVLIGLAYGQKTCTIGRYGKLTSFSGEKLNVEAPCKFRMAEFQCGFFRVFVTPGSSLDGNSTNRFTPTTVWVKIQRELKNGKKSEWIGRTSDTLIKRRLDNKITDEEVWSNKRGKLDVFTTFLGGEAPAAKLTKKADEKTFVEIIFREPLTSGDEAGISIACLDENDFSNSAPYPESLCGNGVDDDTISTRQDVIFPSGDGDASKTVLFDILNDATVAQSKTCEIIAFLFQNDCGGDDTKAVVANVCGNIFSKRPLAKCLVNDGAIDDDFRKCLINKCYDAACNQLKTTVESNNCPAETLSSTDYLSALTCAA